MTTHADIQNLTYLENLIKILRENKIKEYQTEQLHLTFDSAAFYNPPKQLDPNVLENLYGETY